MSRINVYEVDITEADGEGVVTIDLDADPDHSLREGEELMAVTRIIGLVDDLDNGEALVITRENW